jgi:putative membrane protein
VRPLLTVLTCPFILVTLGLFLFVINAMMLLLTAWLSGIFDLGLHVSGFGSAFAAGLMISLTSLLLSFLVGEREVRVVRH